MNINHPHTQRDLKAGKLSLFDPTKDTRGREVAVILTYGYKETTWFPETEGIYVVEFNCPKEDRPEAIRLWSLGMGDCSSPQPTKKAVHRLYLDIVAKSPCLIPWVQISKRPCVFCKDHPEASGGSRVIIPIKELPEPCSSNELTRIYM